MGFLKPEVGKARKVRINLNLQHELKLTRSPAKIRPSSQGTSINLHPAIDLCFLDLRP